jgi:hypothetical protein
MRLWRWVVVRAEELDELADAVGDALELEWYCTVERDPWQCDVEYRKDKLADALQEVLDALERWRG